MKQHRTLVDASGQPIGEPPSEPMNPAVQALIETRVNSALDQLRIDNAREIKELTKKATTPWKWFTALATITAVVTFFIGYSEVRDWIKEEVQRGMTQPEIQKAAKSATAATMREFVENQLKPLREEVTMGRLSVSNLQADVAFASLVAAAQIGEHYAFNHLFMIGTNSQDRHQQNAATTYLSILESHNQIPIFPDLLIQDKPPSGIDAEKASLQDILNNFSKEHDQKLALDNLAFVTHAKRFSKAERLEFLVKVNQQDPNLTIAEWAGRFFNELAGTNFKPLATQAILDWWNMNREKIAADTVGP